MSLQSFPNHLVSHRKISALAQGEVAFLLGAQGPTKVSRHEQFRLEPSLSTALKYEAIFGIPISELFPGIREQALLDVQTRAREFEVKELTGNSDPLINRKRQTIAAILSRPAINQLKQS